MPFTPFHLGTASILALALLRWVSLPALLLGSIAPDIQPLLMLLLDVPGGLHGPLLHSFIGATFLALPLTALVFKLRGPLDTILLLLKLKQKQTLPKILAGALVGTYSHIVLDSYLYPDIEPFSPNGWNPFFSRSTSRHFEIYTICAISFIIALAMYSIHLWKKHNSRALTF